jgi:5-methylcytosine-specific restriction endonuclease McrA
MEVPMHPNDTTKVCRKCGEPKPLDSFTVDARYRDGRYPWCADCRRAWRQGRKDRQLELRREWYHRDIDHARKYSREYYQNNEEARERNRDAGRIRDRERYQNDPEYRHRKDRQTAEKNRRRRAVLYGAPAEHHTEQEWQRLCEKYNHRCLCCGLQVLLTRDHVVPVSQGGTDAITNIQPLCSACNSRKNNRTIDYRAEWEA